MLLSPLFSYRYLAACANTGTAGGTPSLRVSPSPLSAPVLWGPTALQGRGGGRAVMGSQGRRPQTQGQRRAPGLSSHLGWFQPSVGESCGEGGGCGWGRASGGLTEERDFGGPAGGLLFPLPEPARTGGGGDCGHQAPPQRWPP